MQLSRVQTLSRHIGASSRALPSLEERSKGRLIKIRHVGAYPFDLSTMKKVKDPKKTGLFAIINRIFDAPEEKESPLPKLEEFMRPNPGGRFPSEPLFIPFPNPFSRSKYSSPLLLRTSTNPDTPAHNINDPVLKKLRLLFCLKGRLLKNKKGLYFIKLPEQILATLFPFIKKVGATVPSHYTLIDHLGAHIPVIMPEEKFEFGQEPSETGEMFYFAITGIYSKEVSNYPGVSKIWYVSFTSYDLEWLRQKHGLTSSLGGESFHCVIGAKPTSKTKPVQETFRISPLAESA